MKNQNKNKAEEKSTRSTSNNPRTNEQPEHTGNAEQAPSSLHQGQGPEFQTQDPTMRKQNEAVKDLNREPAGFKQEGTQPTQKTGQSERKNEYENPDEAERQREELPSREREEKPYVGDNPEETRRQSPKMK